MTNKNVETTDIRILSLMDVDSRFLDPFSLYINQLEVTRAYDSYADSEYEAAWCSGVVEDQLVHGLCG